MRRADAPILFKVLLGPAKEEIRTKRLFELTQLTVQCIAELLAVVGYSGSLDTSEQFSGDDRLLVIRAEPYLVRQLELFTNQGVLPDAPQIANEVVERTLVELARFHREARPVLAAQLYEVLKQLKSIDPRVIRAISRQPGRRLKLRQVQGDLELAVQTAIGRSLSKESAKLSGKIVAVGPSELYLMPLRRGSKKRFCVHPVRVRIEASIQRSFDASSVLQTYVRPQRRVDLDVNEEIAVRKRKQLTFQLNAWPPTNLEDDNEARAHWHAPQSDSTTARGRHVEPKREPG